MPKPPTVVRPAISVILPVRAPAPWFRAALRSMLRQTHAELEIVVIDDGSPNRDHLDCEDVADRRVRVVELPAQRGVGAALNSGLDEANHALVARMDADDVSCRHRLARQVEIMASDRSLWALGTGVRPIGPAGRPVRSAMPALTLTARDVRYNLLLGNALYHPTILFNRDVGAVSYTEGIAYEDWDLWLRNIDRNMATCDERLLRYRVHPGSATTKRRHDAPGQLVEPYAAAYTALVGHDPSPRFARSVTGDVQPFAVGMVGDLFDLGRTFLPSASWNGRRLMFRSAQRQLRRWARFTLTR